MVSSPIARDKSYILGTIFPEGAQPKTRALIQFRGEATFLKTLIDCLKLRRRELARE